MFDRKNEGRWWDFGWQLVEGCTKVSPGCKNCWSLVKEARFRKETGVVYHGERLERKLNRKKPASYSIWNDLFHPDIPFEVVDRVLATIRQAPQHIVMILTKRADRMLEYFSPDNPRYSANKVSDLLPEGYPGTFDMDMYWPIDNLWLGVTAENQEQADKRIPILLQIPAAVRFVSVEPMLSEVNFNYIYLD